MSADTDLGILGIPGEPVAPQRSESSPGDGVEADDRDTPDGVGLQAPLPPRRRHRRRFTGPANKDAVWRSGAGITADGALVWVGGNGLSIVALANTLLRAGAVRAMQLDINHEWVQFNTYDGGGSGSVHGSRLLTDMQHSGDRYLSEDTRDFIAVFRRSN